MRKKVLLAEDSVTMQKVFELALAQSGISVISVDNGHDAIRLVDEIDPDLVVADVTLPGVDGYGVASAIRETENGKRVPILILSGTMVPVDEERLKACGAKGVLFKPFEFRELLERVEGIVGEAAQVPEPVNSPPPPPADEHWDFSDVLDEADGVIPAPRAAETAKPRDPAFHGGEAADVAKDEPVALNDYDVSIEDLEEPAPAPAPVQEREAEPPPAQVEEGPVRAAHIEGSVDEDAPAAVTDLAAGIEEPEEIEEIQEFQDIEEVGQGPAVAGSDAPSAPPAVEGEPAALPAAEAPSTAPPRAEPLRVPPAEEPVVLPEGLKEQFAARAEEIFRSVATEAVEKAMWEMMDRLAAEFSAKVRESVEAVAWEVIPATVETLIREEIARIRTQTGKPSP
jgi:CheY-like chemotaxis protein